MNDIVIACPKCQAKYKLPPTARGKVVQCKSCKTKFTVGGAQPATPARAAQANPRSQTQPTAELARLGVDGPIRRTPDLFEAAPPPPHDPLANHVIEDPGFAPIAAPVVDGTESAESTGPNEYADLMNNPAVVKPKVVEKKEDPLAQYLNEEDYQSLKDSLAEFLPQDKPPSKITKFSWAIYLVLIVGAFIFAHATYISMPEIAGMAFFSGTLILTFSELTLLIWAGIWFWRLEENKTLAILGIFTPVLFYLLAKYWSDPVRPTSRLAYAWIAIFVGAVYAQYLNEFTILPQLAPDLLEMYFPRTSRLWGR